MNPISEHVRNLSLRQIGTRFLLSGFLLYSFLTLISNVMIPFGCNSFTSGCYMKGFLTILSAIGVGLVFIGIECLSSLDEDIEVVLSRKHMLLVMCAGVVTSFAPAVIIRLISSIFS